MTLAQYAGVVAGIAEDHLIDAVLRNEDVSPSVWPVAEEAWPEQLETDPVAADRFEELLDAARRRYGRRVAPLDEDLDTWLDFVRHWSTAPNPLEFLAQHTLRSSDLLRMHRLWSTRMLDDPELRNRALGVLGREPGTIPVLTIGTSQLVPPTPPDEAELFLDLELAVTEPTDEEPAPAGLGALLVPLPPRAAMDRRPTSASPSAAKDVSPTGSTSPSPSLPLEEHARLCALIDADPLRADTILGKHQISPDDYSRADQHWQSVIAEDEAARARWLAAYGSAAR